MSEDQMSLEGILSDKPAAPPVAPPAPEAPPAVTQPAEAPHQSLRKAHQQKERDTREAAEGRVRDASGKYVKAGAEEAPKEAVKEAPKEEPKAESKEQELTPKEKAAFAAAADERRKRQDLERRLAEYEAKINAAPQQQTAEPPKTFWDDPEAALKQLEQRTQATITAGRVQMAEMAARGRYKDYDEKVEIFKGLSLQNPALFQQAIASPDPAEFAYRVAKNHHELVEAGSIDAVRAQVEKETRLKVEAEMREKFKQEQEAKQKEREALPGSLSNVTGVGNVSKVWGGPTPLDQILKT